ncbi:formate dehydrogenase accessory sulfurtransferase FdhD [Chryseolinea soli]|uniref:Sulfur carrier protein FdhD n=1 Tax=Chryseolinea soli TaxID=2321403 RepID=A0A385SYG0_9BACT|nr:formate dehydrogenase accessory sulfurtransferase FdhD [Chryseolinea soli]AYB35137.1 formate dehydrogenase accessory sulfurtransferase FdhD [Chryseolinea soli]
MQASAVKHIKMTRVTQMGMLETDDQLAVEEPLEIQVVYGAAGDRITKVISVTMRTPGNDEELAAGFLFTEGIITSREEVANLQLDGGTGNKVTVMLSESATPHLQTAERNFYTTSSCGVCGKAGIDAIKTISIYAQQNDTMKVNAAVLYRLPIALKKQQEWFATTGGLHASSLFDADGNLLLLREDVGRHNALDKLIGACFLENHLPLQRTILLLSGRASFELIQKASMAGIKIIASIGAPSSLALQQAEEFGMTLIGFLGNEKFNIYSASHRVVFE